MSDTESFESVYERLYPQLHNPCGLWKAATIAEWLDDLECAHNREIRDVSQQEYHRGYGDGAHSMDAEHRAIAMRLRALPLDGGSHENLSQIARAVYHSDFGWTQGACAALRDELVRLMGGVSDDTAEPMTTDEFIEYINQDTRRLKGDATRAGDGNDTCGAGCCCAAADSDGGDSGEQMEVTDERLADDCGADSRGGDGGGDLHMAGVTDEERRRVVAELRRLDAEDGKAYICGSDIAHAIELDYGDTFLGRLADLIGGDRSSMVTYDVLWNERREAIAGLRDCNLGYTLERDNVAELFSIFGTNLYDTSTTMAEKFEVVRDRLVYLLGGDQPSGIDVLRAMDEREAEGRITDELREFVGTFSKRLSISVAEVNAIADRIDEQFDRICQQQEAVLQSTIAELVEQRDAARARTDELSDELLRVRRERDELQEKCAELSAELSHQRRRTERACGAVYSAERERDKLRKRLDAITAALNG